MTVINPIVFVGLIPLLGGVLAAAYWAARRPPYQLNDFEQSVRRIQECMAGLVVRQGREASEIETMSPMPEWAHAGGACANAALRRDCRRMRRDLLDAGGFILLQASDAVRRRARHRQGPLTPEIFVELKQIDRTGRSLIRQSRRAGLQLVFPAELDSGAHSLLEAGDQFAELCAAFGKFLGQPRVK